MAYIMSTEAKSDLTNASEQTTSVDLVTSEMAALAEQIPGLNLSVDNSAPAQNQLAPSCFYEIPKVNCTVDLVRCEELIKLYSQPQAPKEKVCRKNQCHQKIYGNQNEDERHLENKQVNLRHHYEFSRKNDFMINYLYIICNLIAMISDYFIKSPDDFTAESSTTKKDADEIDQEYLDELPVVRNQKSVKRTCSNNSNRQNRKSGGKQTRKGGSKVKASSTSINGIDMSHPRLKNIDVQMVEIFSNEIIYHGDSVGKEKYK